MPDRLIDNLVEMLTLMRDTERDVFGAIDQGVREGPIRDGDWSPKDHQAHLTAWKSRQADRYAAARVNGELPEWQGEEDEINARLQAARADWAWDAIVEEADAVHEHLLDEVRAADPQLIRNDDRLLDTTFGNGAFHAQQHFSWLREAGVAIDADRLLAFADATERIIREGDLPDRDRAAAAYNAACFHALAGRADRARSLLRDAFVRQPDLLAWAREDSDLASLRDELDALAAQ